MLKGAGPRVAAEGLRVLLGGPGTESTNIELDARARRSKAKRGSGWRGAAEEEGNELLIEAGARDFSPFWAHFFFPLAPISPRFQLNFPDFLLISPSVSHHPQLDLILRCLIQVVV